MPLINELYVDGGVIRKNPSPIGGTWAARVISNKVVVAEYCGVITPDHAKMTTISNNLTEMLALVRGLEFLPSDWIGTVFSDSEVTLGRAFKGYKWGGIPNWLEREFRRQKARLLNWHDFEYVNLQGHPTIDEIKAKISKTGRPVSHHNKWCDDACSRAGNDYYVAWEKGLI